MKKSLLFLITIISSHVFAQNLHLKTGVVVPTQNIGNVRDFNHGNIYNTGIIHIVLFNLINRLR